MEGNRKAFLDTIAVSELGRDLLAVSDNGYNVIVGSTAAHPILFDSYASHPHRVIKLVLKGRVLHSSAAGRYQTLARYADYYIKMLRLPDFGPASQDAIALQQIRERGALPLIDAGSFDAAVARVSNIWASLPGNSYGQPQHDIDNLRNIFAGAGGTLA